MSDEDVKPNGEWEVTATSPVADRQFASEVRYQGWCRCSAPRSMKSDCNTCINCLGMVPVWPDDVTAGQKQAWREWKIGKQPPTPRRFADRPKEVVS